MLDQYSLPLIIAAVSALISVISIIIALTAIGRYKNIYRQYDAFMRGRDAERLEDLINEFNLSKVRKSLGIQLSGGERRRCEIARALAIDPKFILLDEPFAGVDPIAVEDIQFIIAKLKYKDIGVIITDHNVGETLAITDRAYLLYEGTILQQGTPESLAGDEEVRTKYLGGGFVLKKSVSVERAKAEHEALEAARRAESERIAAIVETETTEETGRTTDNE